mgnify:CR=1 FL=1
MSPESKASLTAIVNSKKFTGVDDFVANLGGFWNEATENEPWFPSFENWFKSNVEAFETCRINGNLITIVVV